MRRWATQICLACPKYAKVLCLTEKGQFKISRRFNYGLTNYGPTSSWAYVLYKRTLQTLASGCLSYLATMLAV